MKCLKKLLSKIKNNFKINYYKKKKKIAKIHFLIFSKIIFLIQFMQINYNMFVNYNKMIYNLFALIKIILNTKKIFVLNLVQA